MRKILSGLLVCVMLLSVVLMLTSCGDDGNTSSQSTIKPITITLTTIGDATDEAVELVEKAFNRVTEGQYKVHIELNVIKESEYEATINKMMNAELNGTVDRAVYPEGYDPDDEDSDYVSETGSSRVFPIADENQLDIFLVPEGWESFKEYSLNGDLCDLNMYLSESSGRLLTKYIPQDILDICKVDSGLYGIPSITPYGDCEFLLVNKELYKAYSYADIEDSALSSMTIDNFAPFLEDLANDIAAGGVEAAKKNVDVSNVIPLYNVSSMSLLSLTGKKSAVAAQCLPTEGYSATKTPPKSIVTLSAVKTMCKIANTINTACGIMPCTDDNVDFSKKFAAGFVIDDMSAVSKYSDEYYVVRVGTPKADHDEIFSGVYGVSTYAMDYADRCMEIITLINTNKTIRNLLAYGVENEHYIISEDTGRVSVVSDEYVMPIYRTGNAFLLMQNDSMTEKELVISADSWKYAVEANSAAKVSPYVKVDIDFTESKENSTDSYKVLSECVDELEKLYDEIWVWISEYPDSVDPETGEAYTFDGYIAYLNTKLTSNVYASSSLSTKENSLNGQYSAWYKTEYPN